MGNNEKIEKWLRELDVDLFGIAGYVPLRRRRDGDRQSDGAVICPMRYLSALSFRGGSSILWRMDPPSFICIITAS